MYSARSVAGTGSSSGLSTTETNLMTRLGLARLLARLHALLLHLVGIVRRIGIMLSAHHVPLLPRLAGHAHLLLLLTGLAGHAVHTLHTLLRQLGSHAHLIWSPAGDGVAHGICRGNVKLVDFSMESSEDPPTHLVSKWAHCPPTGNRGIWCVW